MPTTHSEIVNILKALGFSSNVAKAYISLLNKHPATGYEISKDSGIPRSAIYTILNRMEQMGFINSESGTPKKYVPLSPSVFIEHISNLHGHRIDELKFAFEKLDTDEEAFDFWHIHGYENLVLKMKEAVQNAEHSIVLNIWNRELLKINPSLIKAQQRGVDITIFSFTAITEEVETTISYKIKEENLIKISSPKVILVADHRVAILGGASQRNCRAIWTKNPALIKIASDYIVLDLTLAGQRLNINITPVVKKIMQSEQFDLDKLISKNKN